MSISNLPRIRLAHLPTPLEPMENLSRLLDGPNLWIKRDDCTGLSTGGNKTRKLEFLMAEAVSQGADVVVTVGATQSNHTRQTAAFAARLGLACHIVLLDVKGSPDLSYNRSGNVFLLHLHGATIEHRDGAADANAAIDDAAARLRAQGRSPYVIPAGGSNATGALGYVDCAFELHEQAAKIGLAIGHVIHATGSSGTQAGLAAGFALVDAGIKLLGVTVRASREQQEEAVYRIALAVGAKIDPTALVRREAIAANSDYVGAGYGKLDSRVVEAMELFARHEGILLDPVYTGKCAAGLVDLVRNSTFAKDDNIVFLHTGGSAGSFGYISEFPYN